MKLHNNVKMTYQGLILLILRAWNLSTYIHIPKATIKLKVDLVLVCQRTGLSNIQCTKVSFFVTTGVWEGTSWSVGCVCCLILRGWTKKLLCLSCPPANMQENLKIEGGTSCWYSRPDADPGQTGGRTEYVPRSTSNTVSDSIKNCILSDATFLLYN